MMRLAVSREQLLAVVVLTVVVSNVYQASARLGIDAQITGLDAMVRKARILPDDQAVIERFHEIFYERLIWNDNRWLGIRTMQNPNDVWTTQEVIYDVKPDYIVEAGTAEGGSAVLWAVILAHVNPGGRVITTDIEDKTRDARQLRIWRERVHFIHASSTAPETLAEITRLVKGKRVLVILDSDHHRDHVQAELRAYAPLVPVGSYIIVQDTNVNGHPVFPNHGPGPMEAVREFLAADKRFQADRGRERMLFTMHPMGYLRRVQ